MVDYTQFFYMFFFTVFELINYLIYIVAFAFSVPLISLHFCLHEDSFIILFMLDFFIVGNGYILSDWFLYMLFAHR